MRIQMVSVLDAALQLSVSPDTVRRLIKRHQIPVVKIGRRCLIDQQTVERIARTGMPPVPDMHPGGRGQ